MAKVRVIFIPWEESEEFDAKSDQWNQANTKGNKQYHIINYAAGTTADILVDLQADSSIYLRGHGQNGSDTIKADSRSLKITEACQRLIDMGLKNSYGGTIKFFNCYSALGGRNKELPTAAQGAAYFRDQGFDSCIFQGYEGPLRSEYDKIRKTGILGVIANFFDSYDHKFVAVQKEIEGYPGFFQSPKGDPKIRASQGRKEF